MAAPAAIDPVVQKTDTDCALACLAMVFGVPYVEVRDICVRLWGEEKVDKEGLTSRDMQRVAHELKRPLVSVPAKDADLDAETGLLLVKVKRDYHVVVLFQGVVFNPADGIIWDLDAYKATRHATPIRFLRP